MSLHHTKKGCPTSHGGRVISAVLRRFLSGARLSHVFYFRALSDRKEPLAILLRLGWGWPKEMGGLRITMWSSYTTPLFVRPSLTI